MNANNLTIKRRGFLAGLLGIPQFTLPTGTTLDGSESVIPAPSKFLYKREHPTPNQCPVCGLAIPPQVSGEGFIVPPIYIGKCNRCNCAFFQETGPS